MVSSLITVVWKHGIAPSIMTARNLVTENMECHIKA